LTSSPSGARQSEDSGSSAPGTRQLLHRRGRIPPAHVLPASMHELAREASHADDHHRRPLDRGRDVERASQDEREEVREVGVAAATPGWKDLHDPVATRLDDDVCHSLSTRCTTRATKISDVHRSAHDGLLRAGGGPPLPRHEKGPVSGPSLSSLGALGRAPDRLTPVETAYMSESVTALLSQPPARVTTTIHVTHSAGACKSPPSRHPAAPREGVAKRDSRGLLPAQPLDLTGSDAENRQERCVIELSLTPSPRRL